MEEKKPTATPTQEKTTAPKKRLPRKKKKMGKSGKSGG